MKILLIDRDATAAQLLRARLELNGHKVAYAPVKSEGVDRAGGGEFDVIIIDPAPLTSSRPVILNIRRSIRNYAYTLLASETSSREDALKAGANDILHKPVDLAALDEKITNAVTLLKTLRRIGDDSEDFPSAGGVIAKSAFNQLFLSAIDRADRYGERSYVLFIAISNYQEIRNLDGPYAADLTAAQLSRQLVLERRQSDIIGQTAKYEFALLLQRPVYETEPMEAANRFADALGSVDIAAQGAMAPEIAVTLMAVPTGQTMIEHRFRPHKK